MSKKAPLRSYKIKENLRLFWRKLEFFNGITLLPTVANTGLVGLQNEVLTYSTVLQDLQPRLCDSQAGIKTIQFRCSYASTELRKEWKCHGSVISSRVITHNRSDPEDCVTAYDIVVGESEPHYTGLYLTHRPEVASIDDRVVL